MRANPFTTLSILSALIVAGCAAHGSALAPSVPASSAVLPQVLQTGQSPTNWELFSTFAGFPVVGPDKHMWYWDGIYVYRVDIGTLTAQRFYVGAGGSAAAGPDGNVWFCGDEVYGNITPEGVVTKYSAAVNCQGMAAGPDGALWMVTGGPLYRTTTSGQLTEFPMPAGEGTGNSVVEGSNDLVWFIEYGNAKGDYDAICNINTSTDAISVFKLKDRDYYFAALNTGTDGNAYAMDASAGKIIRVTPSGVMRSWKVAGYYDATQTSQANVQTIWFTINGALDAWQISAARLKTIGLPPTGMVANAVQGPDYNVWFTNGAYIQRVLLVSPTSATISVGQTQPFSVTESGCTCRPTATSSDKSIARVTPVVGHSFSVTGVSPGTATITVADQAQNVFNVSVTVP
jgi:virginiamycin B lyase